MGKGVGGRGERVGEFGDFCIFGSRENMNLGKENP